MRTLHGMTQRWLHMPPAPFLRRRSFHFKSQIRFSACSFGELPLVMPPDAVGARLWEKTVDLAPMENPRQNNFVAVKIKSNPVISDTDAVSMLRCREAL